jgi:hypothetical protein
MIFKKKIPLGLNGNLQTKNREMFLHEKGEIPNHRPDTKEWRIPVCVAPCQQSNQWHLHPHHHHLFESWSMEALGHLEEQ